MMFLQMFLMINIQFFSSVCYKEVPLKDYKQTSRVSFNGFIFFTLPSTSHPDLLYVCIRAQKLRREECVQHSRFSY